MVGALLDANVDGSVALVEVTRTRVVFDEEGVVDGLVCGGGKCVRLGPEDGVALGLIVVVALKEADDDVSAFSSKKLPGPPDGESSESLSSESNAV